MDQDLLTDRDPVMDQDLAMDQDPLDLDQAMDQGPAMDQDLTDQDPLDQDLPTDQDLLTDRDPVMDQDPSTAQVSVDPAKQARKRPHMHQQDPVYSHMVTNKKSKVHMEDKEYMVDMVDIAYIADQLSSRRSYQLNMKSLLIAMFPKLKMVDPSQAMPTKSSEEVASLVKAMSSPITFLIRMRKLLMMLLRLNPVLLLLLMLVKSLLLILLLSIINKISAMARLSIK